MTAASTCARSTRTRCSTAKATFKCSVSSQPLYDSPLTISVTGTAAVLTVLFYYSSTVNKLKSGTIRLGLAHTVLCHRPDNRQELSDVMWPIKSVVCVTTQLASRCYQVTLLRSRGINDMKVWTWRPWTFNTVPPISCSFEELVDSTDSKTTTKNPSSWLGDSYEIRIIWKELHRGLLIFKSGTNKAVATYHPAKMVDLVPPPEL